MWRTTLAAVLCLTWSLGPEPRLSPARADNFAEVPLLVAIGANDRGAFELLLMRWDRQPLPNPVELRWGRGKVQFAEGYLSALEAAWRYAVGRVPSAQRTGTIWLQGLAYAPTTTDGPSAGAVMAVGFLAVLNGDPIRRGIALTGTIEPDGRIGPVGAIPDKIRAAAREGYRTVLIPAGQLTDPRWSLNGLALELNITVKEVGTVDEAYELLTGRRL
jgi:hypothetical protein